jgi:hypothetical protein
VNKPKNAKVVNFFNLSICRISMVNAVDIPRCGGTATTGRIGLMLTKKAGVENSGPQNNADYAAKMMNRPNYSIIFLTIGEFIAIVIICSLGVFLASLEVYPSRKMMRESLFTGLQGLRSTL